MWLLNTDDHLCMFIVYLMNNNLGISRNILDDIILFNLQLVHVINKLILQLNLFKMTLTHSCIICTSSKLININDIFDG